MSKGLWYNSLFNPTLPKITTLLPMEDAGGGFDAGETASYDGKLYWWRDF